MWCKFVEEQIRIGCGAVRKLVKREAQELPTPVSTDEGISIARQGLVQHDAGERSIARSTFGDYSEVPGRQHRLQDQDRREPVGAVELVCAAATFATGTGIRIDVILPVWITWLDYGLLVALSAF